MARGCLQPMLRVEMVLVGLEGLFLVLTKVHVHYAFLGCTLDVFATEAIRLESI